MQQILFVLNLWKKWKVKPVFACSDSCPWAALVFLQTAEPSEAGRFSQSSLLVPLVLAALTKRKASAGVRILFMCVMFVRESKDFQLPCMWNIHQWDKRFQKKQDEKKKWLDVTSRSPQKCSFVYSCFCWGFIKALLNRCNVWRSSASSLNN